jgi:8-oxo-dGTP pyrophosphatase MutT (NUDIX family)
MPLGRWKTLSTAILFKNPWWAYQKDDALLPNGKRGEYHSVRTNGSSLVIPVLPDGRIIVVNQYRYLCDRESIEFPCGGVKEGATYDETAVHELAEEAGYQAREWRIAGEFNPYNGVTNEICRVFIAKHLMPVVAAPDETEEFERIVLSAEEFEARIISGVVWDGMSIAAWAIAKPHV